MRTTVRPTLFDLHRESKKSFPYVLSVMQSRMPENCPKTPEAVSMILRRGTENINVLRVFAEVWEKGMPEVEAAARVTRYNYRQKEALSKNTML